MLLEKIKQYLREQNLDAFLIPATNSFLLEGEIPEENKLKPVSLFTGDTGLALISQDKNVLFVDSRYTLQAKEQAVDFEVLEVPTQTTISAYLKDHYTHRKIAYDPSFHSAFAVLKMKAEIPAEFVALLKNPVDLFSDQPQVCLTEEVAEYPLVYAGQSVEEKVQLVSQLIKKQNWDAYIFFNPESVSWLLNIRGNLVLYTPVALKRAVVFADGHYTVFEKELPDLKGLKMAADFKTMPEVFLSQLPNIIDSPDLIAGIKAIKTSAQQQHIANGCLEESKTLCRFLAWLEEHKLEVTEYDCAVKLQQLRSENPLYRGDSFEPIVASGPHAALPHYQLNPNEKVFLRENPLVLIDTGGQYLNATTDMTRTICVTPPTPEMIKRYTQVLKGHIAVATSEMKEGDSLTLLDQKARSFLQADGADYGHSTGHGIGMYLSVHEHPPIVSSSIQVPVQAGMVFSNEPGYYQENAYGIRLENMLLSLKTENQFIYFENLIFVPFDGRLIDFKMLTEGEKDWLSQYHSFIMMQILPQLSQHERTFFNPLMDFFV